MLYRDWESLAKYLDKNGLFSDVFNEIFNK